MTKKLGAVLPLTVRGSYDVDDLHRAEVLLRSLTAFAAPDLFDPFLVVTPAHEVDSVRRFFNNRWRHLNLDVMSECLLVPEFSRHPYVRGWRKQQIVKLAAARCIERDFFITFDADVICTKPLRYSDLIIDNKALLQLESTHVHPKWWRASAKIWGMEAQGANCTLGMSVTPALMASRLCRELEQTLSLGTGGTWVDQLCALHDKRLMRNLLPSRWVMRRWTEYSLYYLFALKSDRLAEFHLPTDTTPGRLFTWEANPFDQWNIAQTFAPDHPSLFCVVSSKANLPPQRVWDSVKDYIPLPNCR